MQEGQTWPIAAKATQSGPNGSRDHLTRENEMDIPSEELLVQSFLKLSPSDCADDWTR
jgi:hypothetical protein